LRLRQYSERPSGPLTCGWFYWYFLCYECTKIDHFGWSWIKLLQVGQLKNNNRIRKQTQHNTQNTKHNTHNNQHESPPPYAPVALPSPSMGRSTAPTTHGVVASYGPMLDTRGLVWWRHCWLRCLGGAKQHTSKNRDKMVP
jgi:hypothetical protein